MLNKVFRTTEVFLYYLALISNYARAESIQQTQDPVALTFEVFVSESNYLPYINAAVYDGNTLQAGDMLLSLDAG